MITKTKIALAAALVLGAASAAQAGGKDDPDYTGGGPAQTWQDIELARQSIQAQIQHEYHNGGAGGAYASEPKKHHVAR